MFRIYPPLIVSIIAIYATDRIFLQLTGALLGSEATASVHDLLLAMTLMNCFTAPQVVINGVAWTLVIEIIFCAMAFCLLPLLKKAPRIAAPLASLTCFLVIWNIKSFGANFFLFGISVSFIPLLLIGQATYFLWARRVRWYEFAVIVAIDYYLFVHVARNINTALYPPANSYGISVEYAYSVFAICLLMNDRMHVPKVIIFYSKMSYSRYLFHGFIGFLVLRLMTPYTGFSLLGYAVAMAAAFAVGTGVTYVVYRLVERPSQRFARILVKRIDEYTATLLALLSPQARARTR